MRGKVLKHGERPHLNIASKISDFKEHQRGAEYHENPFLKLLKSSKKDKQAAKSEKFATKMSERLGINMTNGVSKLAMRRRKRQERDRLKPKMQDMLKTLPVVAESVKKESQGYIDSKLEERNRPNVTKQTGRQKIMKVEGATFKGVLQSAEFRLSPFDALKKSIAERC